MTTDYNAWMRLQDLKLRVLELGMHGNSHYWWQHYLKLDAMQGWLP
jgi:hypothetical protein